MQIMVCGVAIYFFAFRAFNFFNPFLVYHFLCVPRGYLKNFGPVWSSRFDGEREQIYKTDLYTYM